MRVVLGGIPSDKSEVNSGSYLIWGHTSGAHSDSSDSESRRVDNDARVTIQWENPVERAK